MIKVLIIGNSHAAALRLAWNALAERYPQVEMRFFVVGGKPFYDYDIAPDGEFRARSKDAPDPEERARLRHINGDDRVDCTWADAILYIGADYGDVAIVDLCQSRDIDGFPQSGRKPRLSAPAFAAFCRDRAATRINPLWKTLPGRVTIAGAPRAAEALARTKQFLGAARPWHRLMADPVGYREAAAAFDAIVGEVLAQRGLTFAPQPEDTLGASGFTLSEYLREPPERKRRDGVDFDDFRHMNAEFGTRRLEQFLAAHTLTTMSA